MENTLSLIRTQAEAKDITVALNKILTDMYSTKKSELQDYFNELPKDVAFGLIEEISKEKFLKNNGLLKEFIINLQDKINACKRIGLTLAFKPDDQTLTFFSTWAKKNIGPDVLLDIKIQKELVGGALIIAGGKYRDYSIHKKLAQVFQIQKEEILGLLNNT